MIMVFLVILSCFGLCWIILGALVLKFGGSIKVIINNPITKEKDILTNIRIDK
ncbi:MAG: hypothetical protein MR639_08925 [Clostridium sp.]|jgi:hypothetical protein|uniref:hypothetical protein n=1 Tax=Clostridium sp. TaxID=1506 RepID=UPI002A852B6A|nr:hypothetical protein [Clostridium sp.]MDY5096685.1 hypothetical protein [Clostridium sp.]